MPSVSEAVQQADEERRALQFGFEGTLARELVDMDVVRAQADPVRLPVGYPHMQRCSLLQQHHATERLTLDRLGVKVDVMLNERPALETAYWQSNSAYRWR